MKRSGLNLFLLPIILFSLSAGAVPWAPPSFGTSYIGHWAGVCTLADKSKLTFSFKEAFHTYSVRTTNFSLVFDHAADEHSFKSNSGKFYHGGDSLVPEKAKKSMRPKDYGSGYIFSTKGKKSLVLRIADNGVGVKSATVKLSDGNEVIYPSAGANCRMSVKYIN